MKIEDFNLKEELARYEKLWNAKSKSHIDHSKEKWNDRAKEWSKDFDTEKNNERKILTEQRVQHVTEFLTRHHALQKDFSVVDIGCGPGRFAVEFAKTAKEVLAIDISNEMLLQTKLYALDEQVTNLKTACVNFKTVDCSDWDKKFDLVYSSITPAVGTIQSLEKMIGMSKKYCFNANFIITYNSTVEYLGKYELADKKHESFGKWFLTLINIIYLRGYHPIVDYFTTQYEKEEEVTYELATRYGNRYSHGSKEEIDQIFELLKRIAINGKITTKVHKRYGYALWDITEKYDRF